MSLEYVQHLSNNLKRLYFEDPRYKNLRILIKEQCKDKTDGLVFAVRKNEIHITVAEDCLKLPIRRTKEPL